MRTPVSEFVFGFLITFAPAPLVGFATWAIVNTQDPTPPAVEVKHTEYGAPTDRYHGSDELEPQQIYIEIPAEEGTAQRGQPQEMEVETDCKRRKREKQEPPPRKKPPERPDI